MSKFMHLDVFPNSFGKGNHLATILNNGEWSTEKMQKMATYLNLVETTFIEKFTEHSYKCKIFTIEKEIPFAGHPTIGSAFAALNYALVTPDENNIIYQIGNLTTPIRIVTINNKQIYQLKVPKTIIKDTMELDLNMELVRNPVLISLSERRTLSGVSGGRDWWLAECVSEESVRTFDYSFEYIKDLAIKTNSMGLCIFYRNKNTMVVRAFPAGVNIIEDPASGAANGMIASYIKMLGNTTDYTISQGKEMGYDAKLYVSYTDSDIWIGGDVNVIIDGITYGINI